MCSDLLGSRLLDVRTESVGSRETLINIPVPTVSEICCHCRACRVDLVWGSFTAWLVQDTADSLGKEILAYGTILLCIASVVPQSISLFLKMCLKYK